ncbi:cytochrome p450 87a3 [Phtheirospermum japonicum]|uniref:Cytochrome p450 87a3 n=1 Tax=Phtheirospermum japonicum TaxID=374723 RepID=A0A830CTG6_9LAMI|nr:cytochrome p450 87a3 [Phtheirospermum japonicum]
MMVSRKKEKVSEKIKEMVNDRLGSPQNAVDDDLLGQMIKDMSNVNFVTKEYINKLMFVLMFATFQTVPFVTTLALKFMSENPAVLQELTEEHEEILRKRETLDSSVTWEEFKSMTYTQQVINEALRLGRPEFVSKNLKPFGGGIKQCVGADFSRASMAIFLHVLVTKYRWTVVKGGEIVQNPIKRFKNGFHINLRERVD